MATVSISEIASSNPWWQDPDSLQLDKDIVARKTSVTPWDPRIRHTFELQNDIVYSIRGPRQVGKTTMMKLMILDLLGQGHSPRNIMYFSCDLLESPRHLSELVKTYLKWLGKERKDRVYVFLDEVSSIRDWQKAIKHLADSGLITGVTLFLSGSHTSDLRHATERLPGRRGIATDSYDKVLLPMKFSEYVETRDPKYGTLIKGLDLLRREQRIQAICDLADGKVDPRLNEINLHTNELNVMLSDYLVSGGICRSMNDYLTTGRVSVATMATYLHAILGDIARQNKKETYLRQVMSRVIDTMGTPVSWNTIRKGTDMASHTTAEDYVNTLKENFIVCYLHCLDPRRGGADFDKEKKIYFEDPFIFHTCRSWVIGGNFHENTTRFVQSDTDEGRLVEAVCAGHVARLCYSISQQKDFFTVENSLFYWKGAEGKEVDFVFRIRDRFLPVEIKYQSSISTGDIQGLISFRNLCPSFKGLLLTKDKFDDSMSVLAVPVSNFLMLL
jgi:hypothetical protein